MRAPIDPATVDFGACGAKKVPARDFRTLNDAREVGTPLEGTREVWQIPDRPVQRGNHHWRFGVRVGTLASGDGTSSMYIPPSRLA